MPRQWSLRHHVHWPHSSALNGGVIPPCFTILLLQRILGQGRLLSKWAANCIKVEHHAWHRVQPLRESYVTATYSRGFSSVVTQGEPYCGVILKQTCGKYDVYHRVTRQGCGTGQMCVPCMEAGPCVFGPDHPQAPNTTRGCGEGQDFCRLPVYVTCMEVGPERFGRDRPQPQQRKGSK